MTKRILTNDICLDAPPGISLPQTEQLRRPLDGCWATPLLLRFHR